ncbi:MAG: SDR family oxidoreductase [Alphaproteobacteria bacterium]|nr:SDR family oxidoreductase [Alphaproteobacteria bacterium]
MQFSGKRVVVTGACGVHGSWIVEAFAREGATLCLTDRREKELHALVDRLKLPKAATLVHATELTDEASIIDCAKLVESHWGAADVVINNAGIYPRGLLLDLTSGDWDRVMDINVRAVFLMTREFAKLMIAKKVRGNFATISSGAARGMRNGSVPYCTSKTAVERLSKGFALELAEHGIRVNVVEPGFAMGSVVSPLTQGYADRMLKKIPMARESGPADTANALLYLCSDKAAYVTGAVLSVDGGNSIGAYEPGPLGADDLRKPAP